MVDPRLFYLRLLSARGESLKERIDSIFHLGFRNHPSVHHVRFKKQAGDVAPLGERATTVRKACGDGAATLDGVIHDPINVEIVDHLFKYSILVEHAVHGIPHVDEDTLCQ